MSTNRYSPTIRRRRLAAELRRLREERGLTIEQLAQRLDWHPTKLSRVETGKQAVHPSEVRGLLDLLDTDPAQRDALVALAREARLRGWWRVFGEAVPDWFAVYVGLESEATSMRLYESEFIPGLLQTEDYARAVHQATRVGAREEEIKRLVDVRMARQELLVGEGAPQLWIVLDEAVIRRRVGGPDVMRGQLKRLMEAARLPNLTLQVLPFSVGAHAGMDGGFHILTFEPYADDVVYIEYRTGSFYLEKRWEIEQYSLVFDHLRAAALPMEASTALIAQVADELL
ncbi:helix-turn-helix transcriptional regulator [Thermopolyspora sp. NPDC052614]|uniref:helix-turn-helix domain-containing protein n=1 Tax=Thermopolyspora sp. NPDC052614 TaxID=3155682 RepID=UPI00341D7216